MENHYVLFDLDGTITDSSKGIINSIRYALKKMGMDELDEQRLRSYVGPSLRHTFETNYFPEADQATQAIKYYREYYAETGIFENELYDGIISVLEEIKTKGGKIGLATAKPTYFAKIILKHFEIFDYFEVIVGSHLTGSRSDKKEIIFEVLDQFGHPASEKIYMIGDREYDIQGGQHHKIKTIGVEYGYGPEGELKAVGPDFIIDKPEGILSVL